MQANKKRQSKWCFILALPFLLCFFLLLWKEECEGESHWIPDYPPINLQGLIKKSQDGAELTEEEYTLLRFQTGLGRLAIDDMIQKENYSEIIKLQECLFNKVVMTCLQNSPISWEERLTMEKEKLPILASLEDGDILYTPNSHTFGWRNGHVAIVVNSKEGLTLESVVMGENSAIQSVEKWKKCPAFMVLRIKNVDKETRNEIANKALKLLVEVPYGFTGDLLDTYGSLSNTKNTHCAHLVWKAYATEGYNLDSDKGTIVTPRDIATSPLLEVIQNYGIPIEEN